MENKDWIIKEDNICPATEKACDDECCPPGAVCNLKGFCEDLGDHEKDVVPNDPDFIYGCETGDHDIVPILGYENSIIGEQCRQCGKTDEQLETERVERVFKKRDND